MAQRKLNQSSDILIYTDQAQEVGVYLFTIYSANGLHFGTFIIPWRACAARDTIIIQSVIDSVCECVCAHHDPAQSVVVSLNILDR